MTDADNKDACLVITNKEVEATELKAEKIEEKVGAARRTVVNVHVEAAEVHVEAAAVHMEAAEEHMEAAEKDKNELASKKLLPLNKQQNN